MVRKVRNCRICKETNIKKFLSLGNVALPNGFLNREDLTKQEPSFPLNVGVCTNCGLVQLMEIVDPKIMFHNYVYIPSAASTRMQNFSHIASQAKEMIQLNDSSLVIDIGSNDGSLLSFFKGYGIRTLGIDPAENLAKIAELKGIETVNDFLSLTLAKKLTTKHGKANVVTATNVVAHIENLHDLISSIEELLSDNGVFICEFPYLVDLLEKKLFDTIYHEHLSYFSVKPFLILLKKHKLKLVRINRTEMDGGALRLMIARLDAPYPEAITAINEFKELEHKLKLDEFITYVRFAEDVALLKKDIQRTLYRLKKQKHTIVGYGASARGNILLSYCEIGNKEIDFIVDSTPYKQGLYTPGHHIPIYPEEALLKKQPSYTLILAWNFVDEIIKKQASYVQKGGKFIVPVPKIRILQSLDKRSTKLKVVIVMPAHNAAKTLVHSYRLIPKKLVDEIILVDDASSDTTYEVAKKLPITVFRNSQNLGYGGNLKVCLTRAIERNADIIIEYHPDDQYDPRDLELFIHKAKQGFDFALGSRFIVPKEALTNRMPLVKFVANRVMSFIDELVLGVEMSEFHSGFRMYTRKLLKTVPFLQNSDDYLFSFEIIVQAVYWNFRIAEVPISCKYHPAIHTANLRRSTIYAMGTFKTLGQYLKAKFLRHQRGPFLLIQPAPCPSCTQKITRFEYVIRDATSGERFSVFFCTICNQGFTVPVPRSLSSYYPRTYFSPIKTLIYQRLQTRRPHLIRELINNGKVLDIGCGDGNLSQQLDPQKYTYTGIETPFAKSRNPLVKSVGVEGMRESSNAYQIVMFWESFEHLKNPHEALEKSYKALKPGGHLIIECPNYTSWERLLFGPRWFHLDPPRHIFHYTPVGLKKVLEASKFQVLSQKQVFAPEYIPVGLAQSFLNLLSPRLNIFEKQSRYSTLLISFLLTSVTIVMIPVSYAFYLLRGSPILLTVARKQKK